MSAHHSRPGPACVAVIGAGHAGVQAAEALRAGGYEGRVVLVEAETQRPYQRPPLSKEYLSGIEPEPMPLRAVSFFAARNIELVPGLTTLAIDRDRRELSLSDGNVVAWNRLVLATGAAARRLTAPGADLGGIHELRTLDDAAQIRASLGTARRAVVIGAGFIGLEFAAVAAATGVEVTVVEQADQALSRSVSRRTAEHLVGRLAAEGVRFSFSTGVDRFEGVDGQVSAVVTPHGTYEADVVVVGIGVVARDDLARACGLEVRGGIVVDSHLRTSDPAIYAVGDVALRSVEEVELRLECVQNAADQGTYAAGSILDRVDGPYRQVPRFWSHQGDVRLQIAGVALPGDDEVCTDDPASSAFSVHRYRAGRLVAVESVNQPRVHMLARKQLGAALL